MKNFIPGLAMHEWSPEFKQKQGENNILFRKATVETDSESVSRDVVYLDNRWKPAQQTVKILNN